MNTSIPEKISACKAELLSDLLHNAYRQGDYILSSGKKSRHYVNCKPVTLNGRGLALLSICMLDLVEPESVAVAGLTLGADPLVSGVAMYAAQISRNLNALIVRKEAKGHGTEDSLEGPLPAKGSLITVLEDVVTTGGSSLKAVQQIRNAGYLVERVVTIVDREEGGRVNMKNNGIELFPLFRLEEIYSLHNPH